MTYLHTETHYTLYVWDFIVLTLHDILCNTPHKLSCFCLASLLQPPIVSMLSSLKAIVFIPPSLAATTAAID